MRSRGHASESESERMERIYHETQVSSMCGVHCLNTLLQCNAFNEVDLATIGHELDAREREVMAEGGIESEEYLKFVAGSSNNVDEAGNFSVEVLREALKVYNLSMTRWQSGKSEPHTECAFICNLREHWLTVRRLGSEWYNLNSLSSSPERISAFYLSAFLGQLSTEQYTIFSIEGQLPLGDESSGMAPSGKWWTQEEMDRAKAKRESGGGGGADFGEALKNTLKAMQGGLATATSQVGEALGIGARRQSAAADEDEDL